MKEWLNNNIPIILVWVLIATPIVLALIAGIFDLHSEKEVEKERRNDNKK